MLLYCACRWFGGYKEVAPAQCSVNSSHNDGWQERSYRSIVFRTAYVGWCQSISWGVNFVLNSYVLKFFSKVEFTTKHLDETCIFWTSCMLIHGVKVWAKRVRSGVQVSSYFLPSQVTLNLYSFCNRTGTSSIVL